MTIFYFLIIFILNLNFNSSTNKELTICDKESKEALIFSFMYSRFFNQCFQANIDGKISFPLIENDSLQFEYTGYDLLNLTVKDVMNADTVFMSAGKAVSLGSTGMVPHLEAKKYITKCKCCSKSNN